MTTRDDALPFPAAAIFPPSGEIANLDPRYVRSRKRLRAAFLEIAQDDPSKLSVSSICAHTGIDRATFYRHFSTVDELTTDALGDLADRASEEWYATSVGSGTQLEESVRITTAYLEHLEEHRGIYLWALGSTGSASTYQSLLERNARSVEAELELLYPGRASEELRIRSHFAAGGMLAATVGWLSSEPRSCSARQFAELVLRLAQQAPDPLLP